MDSDTGSNKNSIEMKNIMSSSTQGVVNDGLTENWFFDLPDLETGLLNDDIRGVRRLTPPFGRLLESSEWNSLYEYPTWEHINFRQPSPIFGSQPLLTSAQQKSKGTDNTTWGAIVPCIPNLHENEGTKKQTDDVPDPTQHHQNELFPLLCKQIREKLREASKKIKGHQVEGDLDERDVRQSQPKAEDWTQAEPKIGDGVQPQSSNNQWEASQSEFNIEDWPLTPIPRSFCAFEAPIGTNNESIGVSMKKTKTKTLYAGELQLHFKLLPGYGHIAQKVEENVALQLVPLDKASILPSLSFSQRLQDWMIKRRQRMDGRYDLYYYHKESNVTFRSTLEVSDFIVYSVYPSTANVMRKRKTRVEPQERGVGTQGQTSSNEERGPPSDVDGEVGYGVKGKPHNLYWDGQATMIDYEIIYIIGDDIHRNPPNL